MPENLRSSDYACALIIQDAQILLGRRESFRKTYPGCWDVIGGKVEDGETIDHALVRELGEEIGITPQDPVFFDQIKDKNGDGVVPPTYHFFTITSWTNGAPRLANHEHSHLDWFSLQQVRDLKNLALAEYVDLFARALDSAQARE